MGMQTKPSTMNTLNPAQTAVASKIGRTITPLIGQPLTAYPGQMVAPLDPGFTMVRDLINQYLPNTFAGASDSAIRSALSGQPAYKLDPATTENYFNKAVAAPALKLYNEKIKPQINEAFAAGGATFSTRRGDAMSQALRDMQDSLAGQLATTQQQNQSLSAQLADSAANRQMQGVGLANQQANQPLLNAAALAQALAPFQQNAQNQLGAQYQEFLRTRPENSPYYNIGLGLTSQNQMGLYQKPANPLMGALGGLGLGLLGGALVPGADLGAMALGGLGGFAGGYQGGLGSGLPGGLNAAIMPQLLKTMGQ